MKAMNKTPNIIFYFSDQQRWDTVGCYGQKLQVTPNLDKLAQEGTCYEHAFTCQPVCGPARACLQTGQYATQVGCYKNGISLPGDINTLADYLNDAGYDTAYVGKWHLASDENNNYVNRAVPIERRGGYKDYWMAADQLEFTSHGYNGFVFDDENKRVDFVGYRTDCINNYAIDFIHNHSGQNPFFMFVSHIEPHHQNDHKCYEGPDGSKARFKNYEVPGDLADTQGDWADNYPDYLGCCNRIDYNLGHLIDSIKEKGIYDNTIIIYTSDHGSHFKTRNTEYKRSCHDASIRIPMIISGPGFRGGNVIEGLVSLIDLPSTILDCAGIEKPKNFQGNSLLTIDEKNNKKEHDSVFVQISESQIGRAVRTKEWKYSICSRNENVNKLFAETYFEDFLYDLVNDPFERNNLIKNDDYLSIKQELKDLLIEHMLKASEPYPDIQNNNISYEGN